MPLLRVAAEVGPEADPCAHAVPDLGSSTAAFSTSLCGFPADKLTLVPGLVWEAVDIESRCRYCQEDWSGARSNAPG